MALAATNPDHAERIAESLTDEWDKAHALSEVAKALAATNPDHAERIAKSLTNEWDKALRAERGRQGTGSHQPRPRRPASCRRRTLRPVARY